MESALSQYLDVPIPSKEGEASAPSLEDVDISGAPHNANLAEYLSEDTLVKIASDVHRRFITDRDSRTDLDKVIEKGLDLLGIKAEEVSTPFKGACTATLPILLESAVKFQSKAIQEAFPAEGPVKTKVIGKWTEEKEQAAQRVKDFMNFQLTEQMEEYFDDHERMLVYLPIIGNAIKKTYFDPVLDRPCSHFISMDRFHVNYYAPDLERAQCYTEIMYRSENEYFDEVNARRFRSVELGHPGMPVLSDTANKIDRLMGLSQPGADSPQYTFLEQHVYTRIPGLDKEEQPALPYVITIDETSRKVLSIYRNWSSIDPRKRKILWYTSFKYVPWFGFYGLGLLHLIGGLTKTGTYAMRSLIDAGQLASMQGGFKLRGVRITGDNAPLQPGEWKDLGGNIQDVQKALLPIKYGEPSQTLFSLLNFVNSLAQKFADSTEQVVADSSSYGPVGTIMALLDNSTKFFSAIHKRIHKSQRREFQLLFKINSWFLPVVYPYEVEGGDRNVFKKDFNPGVGVLPVSDPNVASQTHRLAMAQFNLEMMSRVPEVYNKREAIMRIHRVLGTPDIDKLLPPPNEAKAQDPLSDLQSVVRGLPIAAFPGQNHDAHIAVKAAFLQDPNNGGNQVMQQKLPLITANIQEHMVMKYIEQIQGLVKMMGATTDAAVAEQAMIEAAQLVLQNVQQQGQQGSVEQQLVDVEREKVEAKKAADAATIATKNREIDLKTQQTELDAAKEGITLADSKTAKKADQQLGLTKIIADSLTKLDVAEKNSKSKRNAP